MLRGLEIRDILIIDRLELEFQAGLNVLTGETGAGKSILLDALGFVLGWRGRAELVRQGAKQGEVTAEFDLRSGHPCFKVLEEAGIDAEDGLILRRVNTQDGRKTAWINDRRVSGDILRRVSESLVELHGQHDDRGLLNPRGHRDLLDAFAGHDDLIAACRQRWRAWTAARNALKKSQDQVAETQAEEEYLRHALKELDKLYPQKGEEAELDAKRRLMQAAEKIRNDVVKAVNALSYEGAEGAMNNALRWLDGAIDQAEGRLDAPLAALERSLTELSEAQSGIEDCLDALTFNPLELEEAEERLFAIRGLSRKYNVLPDELGSYAAELREKLLILDDSIGDLATLEADVKAARSLFDEAAEALTFSRNAAAVELDRAMSFELVPLKMERAVFKTHIDETTSGPDGKDDVSFRVATNPGAPAGPLNKIASGGELSRFLLALKVCLTSDVADITMIFDEIDRGVGGATADAVGRRLSDLASDGQVLVVTHSPQVAALGGHHWRVEKTQGDGETLSTVVPLLDADRVNEITRMISGDRVTDAARAAAEELLT